MQRVSLPRRYSLQLSWIDGFTGINEGRIKFFDKHLSMFPVDLMYGYYTKDKPNNKLDVVIVEASAITEDGGIIPGASVGASPELIQMADKVLALLRTPRTD